MRSSEKFKLIMFPRIIHFILQIFLKKFMSIDEKPKGPFCGFSDFNFEFFKFKLKFL